MGANTSFVHPAVQRVRAELGLPESGRIVLYSGRFGADHPLELLLEAAPLVMDLVKTIHFVLIGDGPTRHRLEAECRRRRLDAAVIFAGDVPREQMEKFVYSCDVGLYLVRTVGSTPRTFAVDEFYDYLKAGRPLAVVSDIADARCFVQANDCGSAQPITHVPTTDVGNVAKALASLMLDDRSRIRKGENARALGRALVRTTSGGVLDVVRATLRKAASL